MFSGYIGSQFINLVDLFRKKVLLEVEAKAISYGIEVAPPCRSW